LGNCPNCGNWHTFKEFKIEKKPSASSKNKIEGLRDDEPPPRPLEAIDVREEARIKSNISELDRVLGGGFMIGSLVLVGGEPGVGKSTLALQIAKSHPQLSILYCAGEESAGQIKQRAHRLEVKSSNLSIYTDMNIARILERAQELHPDLLVVDSIQTVYRSELSGIAGSIQQVKECAALLQQLAKKQLITTLLIGHVTKQGSIAGPRVLEHMVDTVLQFEGDSNYAYRMLRALKNRFGAVHEVGVFEMRENGLVDVVNPSQLFLSEVETEVSGNVVVCTIEGTRPILVEVQALVTPSNYGMPQRTANGFDHRRLSMLLAVLEKRGGYPFSGQDVYLNIAGGLKLDDPAGDLGVMCALVSSLLDKPVSGKQVFVGEVGLGGEIRAVTRIDQRLSEIQKLGFDAAVMPQTAKVKNSSSNLTLFKSKNSIQAIKKAL
jgi:DNA repair protein RadA/Sms